MYRMVPSHALGLSGFGNSYWGVLSSSSGPLPLGLTQFRGPSPLILSGDDSLPPSEFEAGLQPRLTLIFVINHPRRVGRNGTVFVA